MLRLFAAALVLSLTTNYGLALDKCIDMATSVSWAGSEWSQSTVVICYVVLAGFICAVT